MDAHKPCFFYAVDMGATSPVPLVVPAPKITVFITGNAVVHPESIGVGSKEPSFW